MEVDHDAAAEKCQIFHGDCNCNQEGWVRKTNCLINVIVQHYFTLLYTSTLGIKIIWIYNGWKKLCGLILLYCLRNVAKEETRQEQAVAVSKMIKT